MLLKIFTRVEAGLIGSLKCVTRKELRILDRELNGAASPIDVRHRERNQGGSPLHGFYPDTICIRSELARP